MPKLTKEQLNQIEDHIKTLPKEEREQKMKEIISQIEKQPQQCPFCLMSEGKIETTKIYEDANFLAVLEINPATSGHTIFMSKRHIKSLSNLNLDELESFAKILKILTYSISNLSKSTNIIVSEGPESGQKFEHLTINIIPRYENDDVRISWQSKEVDQKDLEKIKEKIIKNFPQSEKPKPQEVDTHYMEEELKKLKKRTP